MDFIYIDGILETRLDIDVYIYIYILGVIGSTMMGLECLVSSGSDVAA